MNAYIKNGPALAAQFSGMIRSMAKLTGVSERDITRGEAGRILKKWAGYVKVAKPAIIERNARLRSLRALGLTGGGNVRGAGNVSINAGIRGAVGRVWFRTQQRRFQLAGLVDPKSGKLTPNQRHFRKADWIDINEAIQDYNIALNRALEAGKRASGLARQSVIQIADSLKIDLNGVPGSGVSTAGIAKARKAIASDRRLHVNGYGFEKNNGGSYSCTLVNLYPFMLKSDIDFGLRRAMAGELGYFQQNLRRGVFGSIRNISRAYPWLKANLEEAA
jgi:hypothetical protein